MGFAAAAVREEGTEGGRERHGRPGYTRETGRGRPGYLGQKQPGRLRSPPCAERRFVYNQAI